MGQVFFGKGRARFPQVRQLELSRPFSAQRKA
jgi:hypothetical protein